MATTAQINTFIKQLGALARSETNRRASNGLGFVLPSVCIAQACIETGYGTSGLMTKANAYFGIKAGSSWSGKVYSSYTGEVYGGVAVTTYATFRAYDTPKESVEDYYNLICNSSRYADGVSTVSNVLTPYDTIHAIWSGGYATDPSYVSKIMNIIKARNLTIYDDYQSAEFDDSTINDSEELDVDRADDIYQLVRIE